MNRSRSPPNSLIAQSANRSGSTETAGVKQQKARSNVFSADIADVDSARKNHSKSNQDGIYIAPLAHSPLVKYASS
jgi:hypothetical protein